MEQEEDVSAHLNSPAPWLGVAEQAHEEYHFDASAP